MLDRSTEDAIRRFRVRVEDGPLFDLIHDAAIGEWRLARAGAFRQAKAAPFSAG